YVLLLLSSFALFMPPSLTSIYPLSLHDALPIFGAGPLLAAEVSLPRPADGEGQTSEPIFEYEIGHALLQTFHRQLFADGARSQRSEEHTSELQSRGHLVCRLLLEKKKKNYTTLQ